MTTPINGGKIWTPTKTNLNTILPLGTPNQQHTTVLPKEPTRLIDKIGVTVAIADMLILGGGLIALLLNQ